MGGRRIAVWTLAVSLLPLSGQADDRLNNDGVVGLVKAGLGPAVIVAKLKASGCECDTSPTALQALKAAGVPDEVILGMIEASAVPPAAPARPARVKDELSSSFQRLQNAVVTVWSEFAHGTGFIVDEQGLILTNQHVVGPSEYIAVQFDERRKIAARLLAADHSKDVAVLWASTFALADAIAAPMARLDAPEAPVEEGERVFTIGSPLNQRKILTTGIASKVEKRAILSDININPGNSGGPLFNSVGEVVGITTFRDSQSGAGVSGIVRLEEALPLIEEAKAQMASLEPPSSVLLPVEPPDPFPADAVKSLVREQKVDFDDYIFGAGPYDVAVVTPLLSWRGQGAAAAAATKSKEKRTKKRDDQFDPLNDLYNWAEYVGELKAVVTVRATPKLRETFMSGLARGLAAAGGNAYLGPATMKFKADFDRMRLYCGANEVPAIHPAKIARMVNVRNPFVRATDATYEGLYTYPADAISPSCGTVRLEIYSEKDPRKATIKVLDAKTVARVWSDFEPWRRTSAPQPELMK